MGQSNTMRSLCLVILLVLIAACDRGHETQLYERAWTQTDREFLISQLTKSLEAVLAEVRSLDETEWNWKEDEAQWSVAEIVEHLITHDELYYREVRVLTDLPQMVPLNDSLFGPDTAILTYSEITPENTGKSPAYLEPLGRWCSKADAMDAYSTIRNVLIEFVNSTATDLRKYYTTSGRGPTQFRDIHQLLLISIAHTQRHTIQIKKIKLNSGFGR